MTSRVPDRSGRKMSKSGSKTSPSTPQAALAIEHSNRTASAPSKTERKPSKAMAASQVRRPTGSTKASLGPKYKPSGQASESDSAAAAYEGFQEKMVHIPAEICQMIMDKVFEEAFGPRKVRPHIDPPIMNIFLALDRKLYRKSHDQYWTKNTWVISKGPLNKTMRFMTEKPYNDTTTLFSLQIPNKAALRIRFAELSFSFADTPDLAEWQQITSHSTPPQTAHNQIGPLNTQAPQVQSLQVAQRDPASLGRAQRYDEIQGQLILTWQDKFDRIAMLNLRHLTLDFTEAYDPRGAYLGVYLVRRLIPFAHGMPGEFKILARDSWLERQTRDAFLVLNAG